MTNIYIDAANLHKSASSLGFEMDYKKFAVWLRQKYTPKDVFLFIGFVSKYQKIYKNFKSFGYKLIFKETIPTVNGGLKGNCDSELVLTVCSDFYENSVDNFILISGDGDFKCLIDFLVNKNVSVSIIPPDRNRCSALLKKANIEITYLNDHYHKFSQNKKAPG